MADPPTNCGCAPRAAQFMKKREEAMAVGGVCRPDKVLLLYVVYVSKLPVDNFGVYGSHIVLI